VSHPSDVKRISTFKLEDSPVRVLVVFIVISSLIAGWSLVSARSSFDPVMYKQLKLEDRVGTVLEKSSCQLCHMNVRGGAPWNPFGLAIGKFRAKRLPIDRAMYEALKLEVDVDQDGFAGTLPGDANSKPLDTPEVLKSRLEVAGGLTQYAPK
jgi:hypothetical protein